jgi:hypothetical protein
MFVLERVPDFHPLGDKLRAAMESKPSWFLDALRIHVDVLRTRLQAMSDAGLLAFGKQMHAIGLISDSLR